MEAEKNGCRPERSGKGTYAEYVRVIDTWRLEELSTKGKDSKKPYTRESV